MAIMISLTAMANKRKLPYPILWVFAGLTIGFLPLLPDLALDPEVVFVILLPPLLYDAASRTSWHEFKTSIRPITALAVTLVFFTTLAVAISAHYIIPGFSWPLAFVLGAIVSPPDAVAASGVIKGLGLNRKVVTIIEGESLVNDASALIAYRYAVTAVTTGTFMFWKAGLQFFLVASAGILIGTLIGYLFVLAHKKIENNPVVETSLTLLAPYVSYLAAEQFHMSGVLAVVTTGLIIAWRSPEVFAYQTRMRTRVIWDTLIFLLHGFIFILIGLQFPSIIRDLGQIPFFKVLGYGLMISLVTIMVRMIWVFAGAYWQNVLPFLKTIDRNDPDHEQVNSIWKNVLVVAWTGTRGVISLAAALALPLVLQDGSAFPKRYTIIFLSFVVILVTLVVQGLSLPLLIRWLKIKPQDNLDSEENELQLQLATHTLQFIEHEMPINLNQKQVEQLKNKFELKIQSLSKQKREYKKRTRQESGDPVSKPDKMLETNQAIGKFQRALLLKLHQDGEFSDAVIRQVERELDIDELKLNLKTPAEL